MNAQNLPAKSATCANALAGENAASAQGKPPRIAGEATEVLQWSGASHAREAILAAELRQRHRSGIPTASVIPPPEKRNPLQKVMARLRRYLSTPG